MDDVIMKEIAKAREEGKKIGLVQGSWDLFHLGHLSYLKEAKKLCDFLVVAMDDDEKIKHRKGNKRPIIPLSERYQTIEKLNIADAIVVKKLDEPHWGLIKSIKPDVLVVIKENYTDEEIIRLEEYCGRVAVLPRQATTSTSDIIRRTLILNGVKLPNKNDPRVIESIEEMKKRLGVNGESPEPIPKLFDYLKKSTDYQVPTGACCKINGKWYFGVNQIDQSLPAKDIEERTELFYGTIEHAEINLLKQLGDFDVINSPVWVTLFPCDKCMKVLIAKGVKEIYYLEDHKERNWSKRSHALAEKNGIKTKKITLGSSIDKEENISRDEILKYDELPQYNFIDPRNVRYQKQLDIMMQLENSGKDPLDPNIIDQEILFYTKFWYVSRNKFPYEEIEHQFLIISLNPIYKIDNMPVEMWEELKNIWDKLIVEYGIPGGALCYRFGDTLFSGASLKRLHAHLIVPKEACKSKFTVGGNKSRKKKLLP